MTENKKRFTIRSYNGIGCHIFDGSIVIAEVHKSDITKLCDLLNELSENNDSFKEFIAYQNELIEQFKTENQQIRQTIYTLYNQERTDMGKNVLKQLLDAIGVPEKETMQ